MTRHAQPRSTYQDDAGPALADTALADTAGRTTTNAARGRALLAGLVAGPLFVILTGAQVLTREAFDITRHPISLLATGELGWIQILAFTLTGITVIIFAGGLRRALRDGRGARWAPRWITLFGAGLITAGVFTADPEDGFPAGTPSGLPVDVSWHAVVHGIGAAVAFDSLVIACILIALRLRAQGRSKSAWASALVAATLLVLPAPVTADGLSVRLALAIVVGFGWLAAMAVFLIRHDAGHQSEPRTERPDR